ncbi:hypothetical protein P152DRAFT_446546 [Eremomyces bilateralis CBS 781.70]|uniref:Uncharacterized protein n=1 Tax=Eremomyces bilateralis CBS 781.70 TaxID=1392243 RepID=A0A6G1GBL9_9PEZI|nr:uncharacterized protein P152DRAFT_446546 [Eremomyces bilateralis CBS 781.70]KAF1815487.1 hypothetical protein P152DRAFT_446546 [Eremomyces bilateralis CBS 781.70]
MYCQTFNKLLDASHWICRHCGEQTPFPTPDSETLDSRKPTPSRPLGTLRCQACDRALCLDCKIDSWAICKVKFGTYSVVNGRPDLVTHGFVCHRCGRSNKGREGPKSLIAFEPCECGHKNLRCASCIVFCLDWQRCLNPAVPGEAALIRMRLSQQLENGN